VTKVERKIKERKGLPMKGARFGCDVSGKGHYIDYGVILRRRLLSSPQWRKSV
jgi:hypothetical protein